MTVKKITELTNRIGQLENAIWDSHKSIDEILGALYMVHENISAQKNKNLCLGWAIENIRSSLIHAQINLMNDANLDT